MNYPHPPRLSRTFGFIAIILVLWVGIHHANARQEADGDIGYELRGSDETQKELWLFPKGHKDKAVKLCETPGWGNTHVSFSPDGYWVIVQDGGASLGVSMRIFRREKGLVFIEIKQPDINNQAEALALKQNNIPGTVGIDHIYVYLVRWSNDSRTVLVELNGKGSDEKYIVGISGWVGLYDLGKHEFIFDLNKANRGTVESHAKK